LVIFVSTVKKKLLNNKLILVKKLLVIIMTNLDINLQNKNYLLLK